MLPIGLVVDGVRHQDFELRAPTVGDNVDASHEVGNNSALELATAVYARQMIRLGTLPADKINAALLMQLNPMDWNAIEAADGELRKKLMRDGQYLVGGSPVAPSSPATASAQ
ncbi:MAG: phage tail assembly protein [Burkholderiaceae bacterium]|nr:MAG: phage tail assembly protein [Burkholderiaceae bacterium]